MLLMSFLFLQFSESMCRDFNNVGDLWSIYFWNEYEKWPLWKDKIIIIMSLLINENLLLTGNWKTNKYLACFR